MLPTQTALLTTLYAIRLAVPVTLLTTSLSLLFITPQTYTPPSPIVSVIVSVTTPRRTLITSLLCLIALTYFLDGMLLVLWSLLSKKWQGTDPSHPWSAGWAGLELEAVVGLTATASLAIVGLWKETRGVDTWSRRRVRWWTIVAIDGLIAEIILLFFVVDFRRKSPTTEPGNRLPNLSITALLHVIFPILRLLLLVVLYVTLRNPVVNYVPSSYVQDEASSSSAAEETTLLAPTSQRVSHGLGLGGVNGGLNGLNGNHYGTFRSRTSTTGLNSRAATPAPVEANGTQFLKNSPPRFKAAEESVYSVKPELTFSMGDMARRLWKLSPYLWPKKSRWLQFLALICLGILVIGRIVNAALPLVLGHLLYTLQALSSGEPADSPWPYVLAYVVMRFLQSSGGLSALRDTIWAPVMQYSDREMSQLTFSHLLNLSHAFHTRRKTGEVLRILDRGATINKVFELTLFNIIPTLGDIALTLAIFSWKFGWFLSFIIALVMVGYITASVALTRWRTRIRREMNERDVITRGIHTDSLLNYETIKYFNGETYEFSRYTDAIHEYQILEYRVIVSLNMLNLVQNFIITLGLLLGSIIVGQRVIREERPTDFIVFITYLSQLYTPLNMLGYIYRSLNTSFVDTERMMNLLEEPTEVNDKPNAPKLTVDDGTIEFQNVSFSYDGHSKALDGVSFTVPKGSSVALVGESGSGKSTVLRLLYRFYDLKESEGRITIDGQDIREVTQSSLRKAIGIVPQDPVLFNASIQHNIGYGKFDATQEEIENAAKSAQMHDRIMSFSHGYETRVGERGVRLSGGEKQRVAIARTLLKNPPILLLDEATSALDTSIEKDIQKALQNLMKGRSSLSIAHRLSTIANADIILVLKDGQIVEQGTHRELVAKNGVFASMWADQMSADADGDSAVVVQNEVNDIQPYTIQLEPQTVADDVPVDESSIPVIETDEGVVPDEVTQPTSTVQKSSEALDFESTLPPLPLPPLPPKEVTSYFEVKPIEPAPHVPIAFPVSEPEHAPVAFPVSLDDPSPRGSADGSRTPAVTFGKSVGTPPRSGTPDVDADGKRKRTASQNFQRLARRISVGAKKGASGLPVVAFLKREGTFSSKGEGSQDDSSSTGDDKNGKKKEKEKGKRRSKGSGPSDES